MRYAGITLQCVPESIYEKTGTKYDVLEYPNLDDADVRVRGRIRPVVRCELLVKTHADLVALSQLNATKSDNDLYVDTTGLDSHLFKRVILDLDEVHIRRLGQSWLAPALFTALNPHKYDAATGEVVY